MRTNDWDNGGREMDVLSDKWLIMDTRVLVGKYGLITKPGTYFKKFVEIAIKN